MRRASLGSAIGIAGAIVVGAGVVGFPLKITAQSDDRFGRIATALEAYALDNNGAYPEDRFNFNGRNAQLQLNPVLTTPIAYLPAADIVDPFAQPNQVNLPFFKYVSVDKLVADNPGSADYVQLKARHGSWIVWSGNTVVTNPETNIPYDLGRYDPTNGTQSSGNFQYPMSHSYRSQRMVRETGLE